MVERLYYDDPRCTYFSARVTEHLLWQGKPAVVLDRTAFYPTGGGQPHDTGTLGERSVIDVVEREADGAVIHVLDAALLPNVDEVVGQIDWPRRFDLMQQHSGQHILSAVSLELLGATTISFHLSEEYATIDLDRAPLSADDLARVEAQANAVVFGDQQVLARFVPDEEIRALPLRKPVSHAGPVRIVQIGTVDCSACGGTHVRATGEVGLVKITGSERRGAETRIEFLCGGRALADYATKNTLLLGLAQEFSVGYWELPDLVRRLSGDLQDTRRDLRRTRDALLDAEATALWHQALVVGPAHLVQFHFEERTPDDLKYLAQRLIARPQTVALLGSGRVGGEKGHLVFARSGDLNIHVGALLRQACEVIGGRGGGRPDFAQGGGPDGGRVAEALDAAARELVESMAALRHAS